MPYIYIYICILSELITLAYTFHLISVDSLVISRIYEMPTQSSIIKIHLSGLQGDISMLSTSNKHIFGPEYAAQIFLCTHNRGRKRTERSRLEFQVIRNTFTLENQHAMSQTLFQGLMLISSVLATAQQEKSYSYTTLQMRKPRHRVSQ